MRKMTSIVQHSCQKNDQLIEKTWFGSDYKMAEPISLVSRGRNRRTTAKNIAKTARRQLDVRYLENMNLTSMEVSMF